MTISMIKTPPVNDFAVEFDNDQLNMIPSTCSYLIAIYRLNRGIQSLFSYSIVLTTSTAARMILHFVLYVMQSIIKNF